MKRLFLLGAALAMTPMAWADLLITEISPANQTALRDQDGDSSDWLEIHNTGPSAVNLAGYALTDQPDQLSQWRFPSVNLGAGGYLLVFASGKDRLGSELHTNFQLSASGEYLALVKPDGSIAHEYKPQFAGVEDDKTIGVPFAGSDLVAERADVSWHVPTDGGLGQSWIQPEFSPGGTWFAGKTSVGFGGAATANVEGLTAYYDFEEGIGSQLLDKSGNGRHGTLADMATGSAWVTSKAGLGMALNFDGSNDRVILSAASALGFTGNFTASAWVRLDTLTGDRTIFGQNANGLHLTTRNNQAYFGFWGNDTNGGSNVLSTNVWTHLAWRFNAGEQAIFVNGRLDNASGGHANLALSDIVELGRSNGGQGWFDGRMDEVAIFNRALSNAEIANLANGQPLLSSASDLKGRMLGLNASAYVRAPFSLTSLQGINSLTLQMQGNDGFVAYLNGVEVARRNAPGTVSWNSSATAARSETESRQWESFNLTEHVGRLRVGTNVLAIHGLNVSASDGSFLLNPVLTAGGVIAGTPGVLDQPTPGRANTRVVSLGKVADTKFSVDRGFYDAPFTVAITCATPGAQIRYTTDGSTPSTSAGDLYSGPITINKTTPLRAIAYRDGFTPSDVDSQTYLFLDDVMQQSGTPPPGWPTTAINGQKFGYGVDAASRVGTTTETLKNAFKAIDTISLNIDLRHLFDTSTGIYTHANNRGQGWERPVSVELFNAAKTEEFHINAGLRIRGGFSRSGDNPKHAFRLFFRDEYGQAKLKYPLFGDEGAREFDNIDLQTSQNYSWSFQGSGQNTMVREVFSRDSQRDMGQPYTRSRYYHLYINGLYWGIYMSQERPEAAYGATYFGGDAEDYDCVKGTGSPGGYSIEATDGDMTGWTAFWQTANRIPGASNTERWNLYQQLQGLNPDGTRNPSYPVYLDLNNLIDYMIAILYVGSYDAPVSNFLGNNRPNNWFSLWNRKTRDRGFQFFAHDCEHSLGTGSGSTIDNRNGPWPCGSTLDTSNPQWIHQQLMAVDGYRLRFADRVQQVIANNGLFTPTEARARANARASEIDLAIHAEAARWGDSKRTTPFTRTDWVNEMNRLRTHLGARGNVFLNQLKVTKRYSNGTPSGGLVDAPLYPSVGAPSLNQFGGYVGSGFQVNFTAPGPLVYYTLDGSDPRRDDGSVSSLAKSTQGGGGSTSDGITLLPETAAMKALVPTGDIGSAWRNVSFNDAAWKSGQAGAGYDTQPTYAALIKINLATEMNGKNTTVYTRSSFNLTNAAGFQKLTLRMKFEDGFVAYLNGSEVARFNADDPLAWNSDATALHDDAAAVEWVEFDISAHASKLVTGSNVLAIHGLNDSLGSSDMLILPEIVGTRGSGPTGGGGSAATLPNGYVPVLARTYDNGTWSALTQAAFLVDVIPASASNLVISEIMYNPAAPSAQEVAAGFTDADDFEYLELMNIGAKTIDLADVSFSTGLTFAFYPGSSALLASGQRLLLVKNAAAFSRRNGTGWRIGGVFEGGLDNGGEALSLVDAAGQVILNFRYDDADPWPKAADGLGSSLVLANPSGGSDPNNPASWRPSRSGGSPGDGDGGASPAILVNEVLTHTDWPLVDAIELFNPTNQEVDVGGWFLTDDRSNPRKFAIPAGTIIPAAGYAVFQEDNDADPNNNASLPGQYFGRAFSLSSSGDEVYLYAADTSGLTGYSHGLSFDAAANGVSFGRLANSVVVEKFAAQTAPSLGRANAGPAAPPVLISEIMYQPATVGDAEYVEIWNRSSAPVPLFDPRHPADTWWLDGIDFDFPTGQTLAAGEVALVVNANPESFRASRQLPAIVKIFGPFGGALDNQGETLKLMRPDEPVVRDGQAIVPRIVVDFVEYGAMAPWPTVNGAGPALERVKPEQFSDDPAQWTASISGGTPGRVGSAVSLVVSIVGQGAVTRNPDAAQYAPGTEVRLTPQPSPGWEFVGWSGDGSGAQSPLALSMTGPKAVTATFRQQTRFALQTLKVGEGTIGIDPVQPDYSPGQVVRLTATPSPGYRFDRWSGGASGVENPISVTLSGNLSVTANFIRQFRLTVAANGPGTVSANPNLSALDAGTVVSLSANPNPGAAFTGWSGDATGSANPLAVTLDKDKTITANFDANYIFRASVVGQGSVAVSPEQPTYAPGAEAKLTAIPQPGWRFVRWEGDATGSANPLAIRFDANKIISAVFEALPSLTLSVRVVGNGSVVQNPAQPTHNPGAVVTLTASPEPGYRFAGWSGDLAGNANPMSVTMDVAKSIVATFVAQRKLTVTILGRGVVTPSPNKPLYDQGETVILKAEPAEGFAFVGWRGDATGTEAAIAVTLDADKTVTADFRPLLKPSLAVEGQGRIVLDPNQASYLAGAQVTATAVADSEWAFLEWKGAPDAKTNPKTITVSGQENVTAVFKRTFRLQTNVSGQGGVKVEPSAPSYIDGTSVTVTATPAEGHRFAGWSGAATGSANSLAVLMDASKTLTATFEPAPSGYAQWKEKAFGQDIDPGVSGLLANPDGDRWVNLLEYALGGDPKTPDTLADHFFVSSDPGGTRVLLMYPSSRVDVEYRPEVTANLRDWKYNGDGSGVSCFEEVDVDWGLPAGMTGHAWRVRPSFGPYIRLRVSLK